MNILLVGDFRSGANSGPSIANRMLLNGLKENHSVFYTYSKYNIINLLFMIFCIIKVQTVLFCSYSKLVKVGILISNMLKKDTIYLMHGFHALEMSINTEKEFNDRYETYIMNKVDGLIFLSDMYKNMVVKFHPTINNKSYVCYNGIDTSRLYRTGIIKKDNIIVTIGTKPLKNANTIIEGFKLFNQKVEDQYKLYVIGEPVSDEVSEDVFYMNDLEQKEIIDILYRAKIYVQNSTIESFGLSVVEAHCCGCGLVLSKNIGATELLPGSIYTQILENTNSAEAIMFALDVLSMNSDMIDLDQIEYNDFDYHVRIKDMESIINKLRHKKVRIYTDEFRSAYSDDEQ